MNFAKIALFSLIVPASATIAFTAETPVTTAPAKQEAAKTAEEPELPLSGLPSTWIQGDPVTKWKKDKLYIFEFWATWCGPCIQAMPHVQGIHEKITAEHLDAQIIGVNVLDRVPAKKLKQFLEKQRVNVTYTLGADTSEPRTTELNWIRPLKVNGIPHAFAVKNGKLLWRGHPKDLSFDMVKKMTTRDFTREKLIEDAANKAQEKAWAEREFSHIRNLFLSGDNVGGKSARTAYIADKRPSKTQKIGTFTSIADISYAQGNYDRFLSTLESLAETFPHDRQAQFEVIRCTLDAEDVSDRSRALKIAEAAARRLIALDASEKNLQSTPYELLSRVLEAQAKLPNAEPSLMEKAIEAQRKAVEYSSVSKLQSSIAEKAADTTKAVFDTSFLNVSAPEKTAFKISGAPTPAKSANAMSCLGLLKSLKWIQGSAPEFLPANKTIFLELWNPQTNGGVISGMMRGRVPARWFREKAQGLPGVQIFAIVPSANGNPSEDAVKKATERPFYKSDIPVAIISAEILNTILMEPNKIDHAPAGFAIRNGEVIWAGNPQDAPAWIFETALDGSYDNDVGKAEREREAKEQKAVFAAFKEIRTLYGQHKQEEAKALIEKWLPQFKKSSGLAALVYEVRMGEPFSKKDYTQVAKLAEELLDIFPNDNFIAERELKILTSNPELKEHSYNVIEKSVKQMARTKIGDSNYVSACLRILAEINLEQGKLQEALGAADAAIEASPENQRLKALIKAQ